MLFCGINPGLYTAWAGHHFARPGNRFWPALHRSGFTPRLYSPSEEGELLEFGLGITNLVQRPTATASELAGEELRAGGAELTVKLQRFQPGWLAMLGMSAYREAFVVPRAALGEQPECIGATRVWLLPNPSGLNAHFQLDGLAREFERLRLTL